MASFVINGVDYTSIFVVVGAVTVLIGWQWWTKHHKPPGTEAGLGYDYANVVATFEFFDHDRNRHFYNVRADPEFIDAAGRWSTTIHADKDNEYNVTEEQVWQEPHPSDIRADLITWHFSKKGKAGILEKQLAEKDKQISALIEEKAALEAEVARRRRSYREQERLNEQERGARYRDPTRDATRQFEKFEGKDDEPKGLNK